MGDCPGCGEQVLFGDADACPDCGKRFCGLNCRTAHTALGVCPDTQDEPLNLDAHGNELTSA